MNLSALPWVENPLSLAILILLGVFVGYSIRELISRISSNSAEAKVRRLLESARGEAKEVLLSSKDKAVKILEEVKAEEKERKVALQRIEDRLLSREELFEKKTSDVEQKNKLVDEEIERLKIVKVQIEKSNQKIQGELERVAGMSREAAKEELITKIEHEHKDDLVRALMKLEQTKQEEIEKKTSEIVTTAIQRYARSHVSDITTSYLSLPSEDLKGKIIGREGRNIRTFERLTGVELIMDESPDIIVFSSFDPVRREVARIAMEKLIKDGRIQPAKIEEKIEEARQEMTEKMRQAGEAAAYEVGVLDLPRELIVLLGRLNFRTSFGQNVLMHSVEMAHISGILAQELGLRVDVAKKGALLHDIGKAVDHEIQGTHVNIGKKILQKYGVSEDVIKSMHSHHEEYPVEVPEAYIVNAADVISAGRPGARRETLEFYIKRLEGLEKIANSFEGVEKVYAIQAGREVRVFVVPDKIDDLAAATLARNIAKRIEADLKYPGEIKINVIRETRAIEYAR
ncbi:MAG: ribonuclease Y [Parcubacteria group bacterium]|nr:ribonuclease Y [Parcubacteria group bacterium]